MLINPTECTYCAAVPILPSSLKIEGKMAKDDPIYLVLRKKDGRFVGHALAFERPTKESVAVLFAQKGAEGKEDEKPVRKPDRASFPNVISSFISAMGTYRNMIPFTIEMSPLVSGIIASSEIGRFVQERGTEIDEFKSDESTVFEVPSAYFGKLIQKHENAMAAVKGAEHLPEIAVIGLIGVYDAYLAKLLKTVFSIREELVFTSDKEIKFSSLVLFESIEKAKDSIIEKEVETVLRESHHEQFSWMEHKFSMNLKTGLDVWPEFIELCERRNLLTHTGGYVSEQYLTNCSKHGKKSNFAAGDKLVTNSEYLKRSVQIITEIGLKLGHVLWRKFKESERKAADSEINETALNLIRDREYHVAEKILDLAALQFKKHSSDQSRRMMIVNLANAVRLGGDKEGAKAVLAKEDWSATGPDFQICVASVREDIPELTRLLRAGGTPGPVTAEQYRDWPVFRTVRREPDFCAAFLETFGETVLRDEKLKLLPDESAAPDLEEEQTRH